MADYDEAAPIHRADRSSNDALELMRGWHWERYNPDRELISDSFSLSDIVSRLAMEGQSQPKDAVLQLLCSGKLQAVGHFVWKKFEAGEHYAMDGYGKDIPAFRWKVLAQLIEEEQARLDAQLGPPSKVNLVMLELGEWPAYSWKYMTGEFSTALRPPEILPHEPGYFEETFSAQELEGYLPSARSEPEASVTLEPLTKPDQGGRPPAADWEAAALELSGRYYKGDFKPSTRADVQRELAAFLAESDVHPAPSTLANHAKPIFEAFQAWERD